LKNPFDVFKTGFDASWELDLFGGYHRAAEAASADQEAATLSRDDVLTSTLAEVARTYIDIRRYQAQLNLAEQTHAADEETATIHAQAVALGNTAGIDSAKAVSVQQLDESHIAYYRNLLTQAEYSLDVLVGEHPGVTHALVSTVTPIPSSDQKLLLAAPAVVLAQRPDIRFAERKLAAATAQQGVALAKFFPDISLVGFIGLFNTNAGNLLNVGSKSWSMGGNVLWPILSFGSLSANLDAADAKQQEALTQYQKAIISALVDVEAAINAYNEQEKYTAAVEKSTSTDQTVYAIVLGRYQAGLSAFLETLQAQRKLLASQNQLTLAQAQLAQNLIAVYKSLGGGWQADAKVENLAEHK
jgi:NodT family efflux transporter outer membrane factor (OMF) lipoprotein